MILTCPHCHRPVVMSLNLAERQMDCPACGGRIEIPRSIGMPDITIADGDKQQLLGSLAYWLAAGKFDAAAVFPGIRKLTGDSPVSVAGLLEVLAGETDESLVSLAGYFRQLLRDETLRVHEARRLKRPVTVLKSLTGLPMVAAEEWQVGTDPAMAVAVVMQRVRDLAFLAARQEQAPCWFHEVQQQACRALADACGVLTAVIERMPKPMFERLASAWADDVPGRKLVLDQLWQRRDEFRRKWLEQVGHVLQRRPDADEQSDDSGPAILAARFAAAEDREEQRRLLDFACSWMTPSVVPALATMTGEPWARDRVMWNLTTRFGRAELHAWDGWWNWLENQYRYWQTEQEVFGGLIANHAPGLFLIFYSQLSDPDPSVLGDMVRQIAQAGEPVELGSLLARWSQQVPAQERSALLGMMEPPSALPPPLPSAQPPSFPPVVATSVAKWVQQAPVVRPVAPAVPPKPSAWEAHIQPFFVENWYIVAGIAMVILGSSLLAYYTWDKHWLVRYTVMPLLLGGFTWSLARVGDWIECKSEEFKGTAAILRGAACGLLPINFMAMALLSADEKVPQKGVALLAMALIYLVVFGWGLRKWCGAVERSLGNLLGGNLLLLNSLVVVGPLVRTVGHVEGQPLLWCVGAGFYLGFAATTGVIVRFSRGILTREMAEEKRVPWFVAGALAVTFVQVFIWVHGFMRHLPQAPTYALLVILTGWLTLYAERRALELKGSPQLHGGESFLGFGAIMLGLLMGFSNPTVRILAFLLAGGVWLYQGLWRQHPLHHWIALTLLGLGGASVGLLPHYPGAWLPLLGVALALAFGSGGWLIRKLAVNVPTTSQPDPAWSNAISEFSQACRGMQTVALVLTAMITPLVQWHFNSWPLGSAAWLVLVAGLFSWRAFQDEQVHWLHATMAILAMALPYAGFMDVAGRTAHHNTMACGLAILSWLWLGAGWMTRKPLVVQARSTVLLLYGILAVAAMLLRVALGDARPDMLWYRDCMDYGGPVLMMLALIPATYYSRSLVMAAITVIIMAILFPEITTNLPHWLGWIAWGSGLGSACCGLALAGICFMLRSWVFLKDLPVGDRLLGREMFPFRRHDHTLFTWPMMAAAVYLFLKVDGWYLVRNLVGGALPIKTAVAVGITGVAWTIAAIYHRNDRAAVAGVHLGWICMSAGIGFGYWGRAVCPRWVWPALVMCLLLQGLYFLYHFLERAKPWVATLLTEPTTRVLMGGSVVLVMVGMADLVGGVPVAGMLWLYGFLAAQLVWHGLRTRDWIWGGMLFFQIWIGLLAQTAPGTGTLWLRLSLEHSFNPTLGLLAGIQVLLIALEVVKGIGIDGVKDMAVRGASLAMPALALATGFAVLFGVAGVADGAHGMGLSGSQQVMLLGVLLLTARAQTSNSIVLLAMLLSYVMIQRSQLSAIDTLEGQIELLASPWRVAMLGLGITLLTQAGRWLHARQSRVLAGSFAMPGFTAQSYGWLYWPAIVLSGAAAFYHTAHPVLRESGVQLWAPYLGAVTFALVAWCWRRSGFFAGGGLLLVLGNIHLIRVFGGGFLRGHGLSELHLICLGIGLGLLQASVLRRTLRSSTAIAHINRASLGLAGLVLGLLSANYFTEPDLAAITPTRFVVSGTLAWLAGWYFRRAARQPGPGEEEHVDLCESLYHFGVVVALWCAALLVPWFRQPLFALVALGLPVVYFYGRAEFGLRQGRQEARRYRNSAAVLGFIVLALYVFEGVFHLVIFPGTPVSTQHYHTNAPLILLLGVVLLRLHGLGGTSWLAFYGGLALMAGSHFMITALPGWSPFDFPMPAAWCALGLGHFWIMLSYARSPLRTVIQRMANLNDASWDAQRRAWGYCLLAATQGAVVWGVMDYQANPVMVAPLLAGAASIFMHLGILRRSPLYLVTAGLELLVALHMDFLIPSYLPKEHIIWVGLAIWLGLLATVELLHGKLHPKLAGRMAAVLGILVLAHVLYQRPWSPVGLWGMGLGALMLAWTPVTRTNGPAAKIIGAFQSWVPVWLVYFSQTPCGEHGLAAVIEPWPVLAGTATLLLMGVVGRLFQIHWAVAYHAKARPRLRAFNMTLDWLESDGAGNLRIILVIVTGIALAVQALYYQCAFAPREFGLLVLLEVVLAVVWFVDGRDRQSMLAYYLMQLCAAACFATIRRHLMLTTAWWTYEYDVWASLAVSFGLAGSKQVFDLQPRALRVPLLTTLCVLPVIALVWVMVHGLGVNLALMVVGLHSVLFAYLGKDNRESPYNILALAGFVGFILLTFYSKLQLRAVHAYIIPVGLGVLVLQELFKKRIRPDAQNWIRLLTLMAMLGSSGYYALADTSHAITFNLTMIILSLLAMGMGSMLRIRLYLALGFAGLMVDLVSLLYKVLVLMERSARMTVVGSLVLLMGAALIVAAIYFKTHKERIHAWLDQWRDKLSKWS